MDIVGVVMGTSGLISIAQLCLDIARAIDGIKTFKEESETLYAIYDLEQVRLTLWIAHVLGVTQSHIDIDALQLDDGHLPAVLTSASPINLQEPLQKALLEISKLLRKLNALLTKYGAEEAPLMRRIQFQVRVGREKGKEEIRELLTQFKNWNDNLDRVVESRMRHHLVSNMHIRLLASAQTDRQLEVIQEAAQGTHPTLGQEAGFMRELLSIADRHDGQSSGLKVLLDEISPKAPPPIKDGSLRTMGRYDPPGKRAIRVLQEWKLGQDNWGGLEQRTAIKRVDRLASMLRLEHKPPKLRCLDVVAYTIADGPQKRLDFCFLYRPPAFADGVTPPLTLHAAMSLSERRRPTLAQRFGMAATLAESLLAFHSANWLHKAVCSANVLFFHNTQTEAPDFAQPFISGFEFSRPDTVRDLTFEGPAGAGGSNAYCHPELVASLSSGEGGRKRHQRRFDIYGLGVVLLEIGCWMSAATLLASRRGQDSSPHEILLDTANTSLPSRVGTRYKRAVCECLCWEDDEDTDDTSEAEQPRLGRQRQIERFADTVVGVLRDCHCTM